MSDIDIGAAVALKRAAEHHVVGGSLLSLDQLLVELQAKGWPEPTECNSDAFAWSSVDSQKHRHVVAVWWGSEMDRIQDPMTEEFTMRLTGRSGVFISGRATVCTTVEDAFIALDHCVKNQWDPDLLAMFGLRREGGLPGSPIFPLMHRTSANDALMCLKSIGLF